MGNLLDWPSKGKSKFYKSSSKNILTRTFKTHVGALATAILGISIITYVTYKCVMLFCKYTNYSFIFNDIEKADNKIGRYVLNEAQNDNPDIIDV